MHDWKSMHNQIYKKKGYYKILEETHLKEMQNWERWHKLLCYENQEGSWSEFRVGYTLWVAHGRCIVICWCNIGDVIITLTHNITLKKQTMIRKEGTNEQYNLWLIIGH